MSYGFGILIKDGGPTQQPIRYLSNEIDIVAKGWPACLRVMAAIALLVTEASKLTLGKDLIVYHHTMWQDFFLLRGVYGYQTMDFLNAQLYF